MKERRKERKKEKTSEEDNQRKREIGKRDKKIGKDKSSKEIGRRR